MGVKKGGLISVFDSEFGLFVQDLLASKRGSMMPLGAEIAILRGFYTPEEEAAWKQNLCGSGGGLETLS